MEEYTALSYRTPLFSVRARGLWADKYIFEVRGGKQYWRMASAYDLAVKDHLDQYQGGFAEAVRAWQEQTPATKRWYHSRASKLGLKFSGFNYWISLYMKGKIARMEMSKISLYLETDQSLPPYTLDRVNFTGQVFDQLDEWDSDIVGVKIKKAGYYLIIGSTHITTCSVGHQFTWEVRINGAIGPIYDQHRVLDAAGFISHRSGLVHLEKDDTIHWYIYNENDLNTVVLGGPNETVGQITRIL